MCKSLRHMSTCQHSIQLPHAQRHISRDNCCKISNNMTVHKAPMLLGVLISVFVYLITIYAWTDCQAYPYSFIFLIDTLIYHLLLLPQGCIARQQLWFPPSDRCGVSKGICSDGLCVFQTELSARWVWANFSPLQANKVVDKGKFEPSNKMSLKSYI